MKSIVLATRSPLPEEKAVRYALGLARRMHARLLVLQVLPEPVSEGIRGLVNGIHSGLEAFTKTMAAAAFCEANEHSTATDLMAMLNRMEMEEAGRMPGPIRSVRYEVEVRHGDFSRELPRFVEEHQDVVLAVCGKDDSDSTREKSKKLLRKTSVPLVSVDTTQ